MWIASQVRVHGPRFSCHSSSVEPCVSLALAGRLALEHSARASAARLLPVQHDKHVRRNACLTYCWASVVFSPG